MRPTTEQEFFDRCEVDHDARCFDGAKCRDRDTHIELAYVIPAMTAEIDGLRRELEEARS